MSYGFMVLSPRVLWLHCPLMYGSMVLWLTVLWLPMASTSYAIWLHCLMPYTPMASLSNDDGLRLNLSGLHCNGVATYQLPHGG